MTKIGRPTKYKPEYIKVIEDYLIECNKSNMKLPKRVDIALLLDVDEDTLNNWARKHKRFFGALSRVDRQQKSTLIDDSFFGGKEINANVGIFLLKANHGLIETSHTDITTAGKPLPQPLIDVRKNNSHAETAGTKETD